MKHGRGRPPETPPNTHNTNRAKKLDPKNYVDQGRTKYGVPRKIIDWDQVSSWVAGGASGTQCAAAMGMSHTTLYIRCQEDLNVHWSEFYDIHREKGNRMLHNKQFQKAMNGSERMLIWLGKNRLGQADKVETKMEVANPVTVYLPDNQRQNDPEE